jgi:hypothetical protein
MTAVRKELRRRRKPLWFATAFVALAAVLVFAFGASANLPGSTFEGNDGNFAVDTAGNTDWVNVHGGVTTGVDLPTGQTDNSFGNGTKESDVNVTVGTGSIPNSKADLGNFYVANETLANNHVLMYLGWTRVNTSGTTNFDFEINQVAQPDLTTPGPKTLVRTAGDIIINYDFQGGAQHPTLAFRTWQANGTWSAATPITGASGEAEVNRVDLTNPLAQSPSPSTAPAFTFGEAAIDLTALNIVPPGACTPFSSAYVKSRSSDAFTSAVKDFIAPVHLSLDRCGKVIIRKQTDPDGATASFGYTKAFTTQPATGNTFSLQDGGSKTFTGVVQGNGLTVTEDTLPAGWDFDHVDCSASTNVSVDTSAAPLITFNIDDASDVVDCTYYNRSRGTIILKKVTDSGNGSFVFTSSTLPGAPFTLTTTGAGEAGADTETISNLVPGTYDAAETVPANWHIVGTASCNDTDSTPGAINLAGGETVTCTWHDDRDVGAIDIYKLRKHAADGAGEHPQANVAFTVKLGSTTVGSGTTDSTGHACVSGLLVSAFAGDYTVIETVPSGYHSQDDSQDVTVVTSSGCATDPDNADADVTFHNTPLTNLTVSIDSQVVGGTASTVDCDNNALDLTTGAGGDGSVTASNQEPQTIHCTIVVDP